MKLIDSAYVDLDRFESLLAASEKRGATKLSFEDLRELGRLYRQYTTLLARARHRDSDPDAIRHLNALCARAYTFLYGNARSGRHETDGFGSRVATALGRSFRAIVISWCLLGVGVAVGAGLSARDVASVHTLMPAQMGYSGLFLDDLIRDPEVRLEFLEPGEVPAHQNTLFGSHLFTHNTQVGLTSFALGFLAGVPTVVLILYNGIIVGTIGWVFMRGGTSIPFLAWILPHGIPEFTAIVLCTAGGLLLGLAVVAPGRAGRKLAIRDAVESATTLVILSIPFFLIAAGIESFVRESTLGIAPRFVVAASMLGLLAIGMLWLHSRARRDSPDTAWIYQTILPGAARENG